MKSWIYSKTFWVNVVAIAGIILRGQFDLTLGPESEIVILGFVNLILRKVTKEEVAWKID